MRLAKTLEEATLEHPEAFAYARKLWEEAGEVWDEELLQVTMLEIGQYAPGGVLNFSIYPRSVLEARAKGEEPGKYHWISGELPLAYSAEDFEPDFEQNGLSGIDLVEEG